MTFPLFSTIGYSYRLLLQSLPTLLGLLAIALVIGMGLGFFSTTMLVEIMNGSSNPGEGFISALAGAIVIYIVIGIFFLWIQNSAVMIVGSIAIGHKVTIGNALSRGLKTVPIIFCFLFLYYLVTSLFLYPLAMLLQGFGMSLNALNLFSAILSFTLLTIFLPVPFLAIVDKAGFNSLKKSIALTRGSRFKIFLGILISYLTALIIALVLYLIAAGILSSISYDTRTVQEEIFFMLLFIAVGTAAYFLIMSIILCYCAAVYAVLKVNKDTMDKALEEAMADMAQDTIPPQNTDTV